MPAQGCTLAWLITAALLLNSIAAGTATPTYVQGPLQQNQTAEQHSANQLQPGNSAEKLVSVPQVTANGSAAQADATVPSTGNGLQDVSAQSGPEAVESPDPDTASSDAQTDDAVQDLNSPDMDVTGSDTHEEMEPMPPALLAAEPERPAETSLQHATAVNTPESSGLPTAGSDGWKNQTAKQLSANQLQPGNSAEKQVSVLQVTANGSAAQADATVPVTGTGIQDGPLQSGLEAVDSPYPATASSKAVESPDPATASSEAVESPNPATASSDAQNDDAVQDLEWPSMTVTGSDTHEGVEPMPPALLAAEPERPAETSLQHATAVNTPESSGLPTAGSDGWKNQTAEQLSANQLPGNSAEKQVSVPQVTANGSESQADATVPITGTGLQDGPVQSGPEAGESPDTDTASSGSQDDDAVQGLEWTPTDVTGNEEHEGVEPVPPALLAAEPERPAEPSLQHATAVNTPESSELPAAGSGELHELQRENSSGADTNADQAIEAQHSHGGAGQAATPEQRPQSNMQDDQHEAAHGDQGLQQQNTEDPGQPVHDTLASQGFMHNASDGADAPETLPGTINHTAPSSTSSTSSNNSSSSSSSNSSSRATQQAALAAHNDTQPAELLGQQQHSEQTMSALASAVSDVLHILQNLATTSQNSTDGASNPPEKLAQAEDAKNATSPAQVADMASGAAGLTGQDPPAAVAPEIQRFTGAVSNALEALQSMQPNTSTPVAHSSTQQQEGKAGDGAAVAADPSSVAGISPETAGPTVENTAASGDSQDGVSSAAKMVPQHNSSGPLPTVTTDSRAQAAAVQAAQAMMQAAELLEHKLLVQSVAQQQQHLTDTLASLLNILQHLQRGSVTATPAQNSTEHEVLSSAADITVRVASWGTASHIHGLRPAARQQQPEAEYQQGEMRQLSAAVETLLNTARNTKQQPGHSSMMSAASTEGLQHLQPVTILRSKSLGGLHELRPGQHDPYTAARLTAPLPHAPSSRPVSGFTDRSHKGLGLPRGPSGLAQAGVRANDRLTARTQQNKEGAGGTAQTCSTVVAVLRVQQQLPGELCDKDQAKLDALREQVLGLLVPYFYSQAVMPNITSGVLTTKCDGAGGIALIRVAIQACLQPAQQERVTCVAKYLTSTDTGNICRQIPDQCSMFAIQSLFVGRVRGALSSRVVLTPGRFALSFDPCVARLPPRFCSSHTLLPQRCKQTLDSHGWNWQGQQLVREVTGQETDGKTPDVGDQARSGADDKENVDATLEAHQLLPPADGLVKDRELHDRSTDDRNHNGQGRGGRAQALRLAEEDTTTRSHDKQQRDSKHRGRPGEDAQDGGLIDASLLDKKPQAARTGDSRSRDGAQGRRQWDHDIKARHTNQQDPEPQTQFGGELSSLRASRASSHSSTQRGHTKQPQDLAASKQLAENHASREAPADNSSKVSITKVQEMLVNMEEIIASLEAAGEDVQNDPEVQEVVVRATALIDAMEAEEDKAQVVGTHVAQPVAPHAVQKMYSKEVAAHAVLVNRAELQQLLSDLSAVVAAAEATFAKWQA